MARKKKTALAYRDVKHIMDLAVERPGLRYELTTVGKAINFKQRCNMYRNMMRELEAERVQLPGYMPEVAYDILVIRQVNSAGDPDRQGKIIRFDHEIADGRLIDPETGEEIQLNIPSLTDHIVEPDDE